MNKPNPRISIFFHNYYGEHEKWIRFFADRIKIPFVLFYNIVEDSIYNLDSEKETKQILQFNNYGSALENIILRRSSNLGKDIGGKMVLMDAFLHIKPGTEYIIFLHDKKSPYKIQNEEWKKKLFRIIEPVFIDEALSVFGKNKEAGIVAGMESIINEYDYSLASFKSNNKTQLTDLQQQFQINAKEHLYIAGVMFWARAVLLENFFTKYHPLDIRGSLEKGNVMDENTGSNTHAWERLLSWLVVSQGYGIKGL